ncbi:hypothetical protein BJX76DRAFT_364852, partial [Aspergillus varians]
MKRKTPSEPPDHAGRRPRQDPVSCESCRRKKLKCDRQHPCSSCVSRGLACTFHANNHSNALAATTAPEAQRANLSRSRALGAGPKYSREPLVTADWLEHIHMGDRVPAALSPQFRAELDEKPLRHDEAVGAARILLSVPSRSLTPDQNPATVDLLDFLPSESDTAALFTYYGRYISYLYHIIIPQVVEGQINEVYRCVERGSPVNPNYLALLFAITGSSLFLQCSIESSRHAALCSQRFSFLTGSALTQANYRSYPTIEGLQAVLTIFHNISNVHCCTSVSGFFMIGSIIDQAKSMMLHRVDTPISRGEGEAQGVDAAELEIKRRLWWDIASVEWYLSFLSGPQEWTYLVNPAFMFTDKPSNVDDAAVGKAPSQPRTTPTSMSFFIERLKLAETCRIIVDAISFEQLTGQEVEYSKILELDRRIQEAQADTPDFLRVDASSRRRFASLHKARPNLSWQGCLLQQAYYSRRCRLHRPFFIRGARDPTYSYSYMTGLDAARKVLEIKRIMDEEEPRFTPSSSAVWAIIHHVFMAAVMLLLDVCYNADDILADKRKEEVLNACRMLSKAQQSSALVKEGIDGMMCVLQGRYKNRHHACTTSALPSGHDASQSQAVVPRLLSEESIHPPAVEPNRLSVAGRPPSQGNRDLEDIWSELIDNGGNMDFETEDWTELFTDLNNATLPAGS